jgi:hypothetical protein
VKLVLAAVLLLLSSAVFASEPTTPDEYFEQARQKNEQMTRVLDELLQREADGKLDPKAETATLKRAMAIAPQFKHDLQMASQGGHIVATYLLANMDSKPTQTTEERTQVCELLQKAMDAGLFAATVAYFSQCDKVYMRYDFRSAVHLKYLEQLRHRLERVDEYQDNYPLPIKRSFCFQDLRAPLKTERTLANLQAEAKALLLSYDQYRAEAYYILASTSFTEKGQPEKLSLDYLNQALALGCTDTLELKDYYEKEFGGAQTK